MNPTTLPTLILGGGFTGLFTALHLSHQHYKPPTILIDQEWSFIFKPLLYEFLSGEMNLQYLWPRYDYLLHNSGVAFVQDRIQAIDLQQRQVHLASGLHYTYNNLVLSLGGVAGYFGVEGAKEQTLPFRTGEDAMALGRHLSALLSTTSDPNRRPTAKTYIINRCHREHPTLAKTLDSQQAVEISATDRQNMIDIFRIPLRSRDFNPSANNFNCRLYCSRTN